MRMTATSPAARAAWLEKHALPKARKLSGKALSSGPMCELIGVHWNSLRKWTQDFPGFEESGAFERGDRGMNYQFKPLATVKFLIAHFNAEAARRAAAAKQVRDAIGANLLEGLPQDVPLADTSKGIAVRRDLIRQQEEERQLVRVATVEDVTIGAWDRMRDVIFAAADKEDPTGKWDPETRAIVDRVLARVATDQHEVASEYVSSCRPAPAESGRAVR